MKVSKLKFAVVLFFGLFIPLLGHAAPVIIYSGVDKPIIYPSDWGQRHVTLTFSLIASDNNSLDTLAGAVLIDPVKKVPYGTFQSGDQKGAYQLILTQDQIVQVRAHDPFTDALRTFEIQVFNSKGEMSKVDIKVNFILMSQFIKRSDRREKVFKPSSFKQIGQVDRLIDGNIVRGEASVNVGLAMYFESPGGKIYPSDLRQSCALMSLKASNEDFSFENVAECQTALEEFSKICRIVPGADLEKRDNLSWNTRQITCSKPISYFFFKSFDGTVEEAYVGL